MTVADRLGPARGRGVLGADAATRREHGRTATAREVEDHADVAPAAERAAARERSGRRILEARSERQHERARTVVDRDAIVPIPELQTEQDLGEVMAACGELVEHLALGHEARLLDVIESARGVEQRYDATPVAPRSRRWGV